VATAVPIVLLDSSASGSGVTKKIEKKIGETASVAGSQDAIAAREATTAAEGKAELAAMKAIVNAYSSSHMSCHQARTYVFDRCYGAAKYKGVVLASKKAKEARAKAVEADKILGKLNKEAIASGSGHLPSTRQELKSAVNRLKSLSLKVVAGPQKKIALKNAVKRLKQLAGKAVPKKAALKSAVDKLKHLAHQAISTAPTAKREELKGALSKLKDLAAEVALKDNATNATVATLTSFPSMDAVATSMDTSMDAVATPMESELVQAIASSERGKKKEHVCDSTMGKVHRSCNKVINVAYLSCAAMFRKAAEGVAVPVPSKGSPAKFPSTGAATGSAPAPGGGGGGGGAPTPPPTPTPTHTPVAAIKHPYYPPPPPPTPTPHFTKANPKTTACKVVLPMGHAEMKGLVTAGNCSGILHINETCFFKCHPFGGLIPTEISGPTTCTDSPAGAVISKPMCSPRTIISLPGQWCPSGTALNAPGACEAAAKLNGYNFTKVIAKPSLRAPPGCYTMYGKNTFILNENPQTTSPGNRDIASVCLRPDASEAKALGAEEPKGLPKGAAGLASSEPEPEGDGSDDSDDGDGSDGDGSDGDGDGDGSSEPEPEAEFDFVVPEM
jgi:hypothetical protein